MIEPEIAFADLRENMEVAEGYVRFTLKYALEKHPEEFAYLEEYEKKVLADRKKEIDAKDKGKARTTCLHEPSSPGLSWIEPS